MGENSSNLIGRKTAAAGYSRPSPAAVSDSIELKSKIEISKKDNSQSLESREVIVRPAMKMEEQLRVELSSLASDLNRRAGQLSQSKESIRKEREKLEELKVAYELDQEDVQEVSKQQLKQLRIERQRGQEQILKEQNSIKAKSLNQKLVSYSTAAIIPNIEFPEIQNLPLDSVETKQQISKTDQNIKRLIDQEESFESARNLLSDIFLSVRAEIEYRKPETIDNLALAENFAVSLSSELSNLSKEELLSTSKFDPKIVSELLKT